MDASQSYVIFTYESLGSLNFGASPSHYTIILQIQGTDATVYQEALSFPLTTYFASLLGILGLIAIEYCDSRDGQSFFPSFLCASSIFVDTGGCGLVFRVSSLILTFLFEHGFLPGSHGTQDVFIDIEQHRQEQLEDSARNRLERASLMTELKSPLIAGHSSAEDEK